MRKSNGIASPPPAANPGAQTQRAGVAPAAAASATAQRQVAATRTRAPQPAQSQAYAPPRPLQRGGLGTSPPARDVLTPVQAAKPVPAVTSMADRQGMTPFSSAVHPSALLRRG